MRPVMNYSHLSAIHTDITDKYLGKPIENSPPRLQIVHKYSKQLWTSQTGFLGYNL